MKFLAAIVLFVVVAITWSKLFGLPSQYRPLRDSLEAAYAASYGNSGGTVLCKYKKLDGRRWLGCSGGSAPAVAIWELVDSAGVPQCLASNGKALDALERFPSVATGITRARYSVLPSGVLSAFE